MFERSNKGARLTLQGQRLVEHARLINESVRRAKEDLLEDAGTGAVSIAIGIAPAAAIIPEIGNGIIGFRRQNPRVHLRILEMRPAQLLQGLSDGTLDFAVSSQMPISGRAIDATLMGLVPSVLACRKGHALRHASRLSELLDADWLTHDPIDDLTSPFRQLFDSETLPIPTRVTECTASVTAHHLVAHTDSITLLSSISFAHKTIADSLVVIPVQELLPMREFVLIARNRHVFSTPVRRLYETFQNSLKKVVF